jgi:hypothetical protein
MNRSTRGPSIHFFAIAIVSVIFIASIAAHAQTTTDTTPTTDTAPVKKTPPKKTPPPPKAKPQKQTAATTTAATAPVTTAAATPAASSALPAAANRGTTAASPVGTGTLAWGTRVYTSTGCVHNGSSAVCTFTFVNQGNQANLVAFNGGEMAGIQMVDDAHVPHRWTSAYFMDKYGEQQKRLVVQPGDTGTYMIVFANVDPQVSSAEFHLRTQIVGGITVGPAETKPATPTAATK